MTTQAHADSEAGGAGLLGLGLGVCVAMLITGGVSVTTTQLARSDIMDAAAHASASAADRISEGAVYGGGVDTVTLDPALASAEARRVVSQTSLPKHVTSWGVTRVSVDGNTVNVQVRAVVKPPIIGSAMSALGQPLVVTVNSHADAHVATAP